MYSTCRWNVHICTYSLQLYRVVMKYSLECSDHGLSEITRSTKQLTEDASFMYVHGIIMCFKSAYRCVNSALQGRNYKGCGVANSASVLKTWTL